MAYEKQVWAVRQTATPLKMEHIEQGITDLEDRIHIELAEDEENAKDTYTFAEYRQMMTYGTDFYTWNGKPVLGHGAAGTAGNEYFYVDVLVESRTGNNYQVKRYKINQNLYRTSTQTVSETILESYYSKLKSLYTNTQIDTMVNSKIGDAASDNKLYGRKNGSWVEVAGNNYSTTEHIVGKWIDGSDIWEKTITKNTISYGEYDPIDCGIDVGSKIIHLDGYYYNATNDYILPLNYVEDNYELRTTIWQNSTINQIASFIASHYTTISGAYFTIRYTKPTT